MQARRFLHILYLRCDTPQIMRLLVALEDETAGPATAASRPAKRARDEVCLHFAQLSEAACFHALKSQRTYLVLSSAAAKRAAEAGKQRSRPGAQSCAEARDHTVRAC